MSLVEHVVVPLARAFAPQLVLVSAGYDAHGDDPLAECAVTEDGYAEMTALDAQRWPASCGPARRRARGRLRASALGRSVAATLAAMQGPRGGDGARSAASSPEAGAALERLRQWWPDLGD